MAFCVFLERVCDVVQVEQWTLCGSAGNDLLVEAQLSVLISLGVVRAAPLDSQGDEAVILGAVVGPQVLAPMRGSSPEHACAPVVWAAIRPQHDIGHVPKP